MGWLITSKILHEHVSTDCIGRWLASGHEPRSKCSTMGIIHGLIVRVLASPLLLLIIAPIAAVVHPKVVRLLLLWHILIVVDVIVDVMTYEKLLLLLST